MIIEAALAELNRRMANMIRFGRVAMVDHGKHRVRVHSGDILTGWLRWQVARAGDTRTWCPPTVGEQVMIVSPSGDIAQGVVIPAFYCDDRAAPDHSASTHVIEFPDGARIRYDHAAHELTVTGIATATISASASVTLDTPLTHCTGKLIVDDLLMYGNGIAGTGGSNANTITGDFTQTGGTLSSNGIVLDSHRHTGVQPGGGNSGGPT